MIDIHDLIDLQQKIGKAIDNKEVNNKMLNNWWQSLNVMITILIKEEEE